jgi:DNA polymerase-3 subunit epsilon
MPTPWRGAEWCALDLELTGLDPDHDHIIAVGMVPILDGRVRLGRSLYTLVRSTRRSQLQALLTHRLRTADVAQAPSLPEALELILEALAGRVPVFHTAAVERAFLAPHLRALGVSLPEAADTAGLARSLWRQRGEPVAPLGPSLGELVRRLGQRAEPAHHALGDALTTAQAFITLASLLDAERPQTVGTLLTLSAA